VLNSVSQALQCDRAWPKIIDQQEGLAWCVLS